MIEAIDRPLDAEKVAAAKAAYDEIEAEGYGFEEAITNYNKLLGYLDELEESYETPEAIKSFLDKITGEWNTFADVDYGTVKSFLDKVYVNYHELLTEEQRNEFTAADQQKIEDLKVAGDKLMSELANLQNLINDLDPTTVDLSDAEPEDGAVYLVKEALKAVEQADEDDNTAVANKTTWKNQLNLDNLTEAEARIQAIKDAMAEFIEEVENLPAKEDLDFETAQDVFTAEEHYNNLSDEAKQDPDVQEAYEKLKDLLEEANKYEKFSDVYAAAVKAFAAAYYNKTAGTEFTDLEAFYIETVTLPTDFSNLKVGGATVGDETIRVSVGNNNFIEAPAFRLNGKKLQLALPLVGSSLINGELQISYTSAGETVTKTLIAYTVLGSLNMGAVDAVYTQANYESTVTLNGSMVTFKSEHGAAAVSIALNNNGAAIVDVPYMFVKYENLAVGSVPTYAFTAFEESGCVIYPRYSNAPITQETATAAQSRYYYISLDGYGTLAVLLSYEYVVKA